jgi:hypothetical protein
MRLSQRKPLFYRLVDIKYKSLLPVKNFQCRQTVFKYHIMFNSFCLRSGIAYAPALYYRGVSINQSSHHTQCGRNDKRCLLIDHVRPKSLIQILANAKKYVLRDASKTITCLHHMRPPLVTRSDYWQRIC